MRASDRSSSHSRQRLPNAPLEERLMLSISTRDTGTIDELPSITRRDSVAAPWAWAFKDAESAGLHRKAGAIGEVHGPLAAARIVRDVGPALAVVEDRVKWRVGTYGPVNATDEPERREPEGDVRPRVSGFRLDRERQIAPLALGVLRVSERAVHHDEVRPHLPVGPAASRDERIIAPRREFRITAEVQRSTVEREPVDS